MHGESDNAESSPVAEFHSPFIDCSSLCWQCFDLVRHVDLQTLETRNSSPAMSTHRAVYFLEYNLQSICVICNALCLKIEMKYIFNLRLLALRSSPTLGMATVSRRGSKLTSGCMQQLRTLSEGETLELSPGYKSSGVEGH